jgi:hypothetical protein
MDEGRRKESFSREEKEEVEIKGLAPPLPFIRQGEHVTLMRWDKPIGRVCVHAQQVWGGARQVVRAMNAL